MNCKWNKHSLLTLLAFLSKLSDMDPVCRISDYLDGKNPAWDLKRPRKHSRRETCDVSRFHSHAESIIIATHKPM